MCNVQCLMCSTTASVKHSNTCTAHLWTVSLSPLHFSCAICGTPSLDFPSAEESERCKLSGMQSFDSRMHSSTQTGFQLSKEAAPRPLVFPFCPDQLPHIFHLPKQKLDTCTIWANYLHSLRGESEIVVN